MYEELAQNFQHAESKVNIAKLDADEHKDLARKYGVQGFPTLKWFDGKSKDPSDYSSGRDIDSLQSFITEKTGLKPRSNKPQSNVVMLKDSTFNDTVGGDEHVLVAFTAPWCGRKDQPPCPENAENSGSHPRAGFKPCLGLVGLAIIANLARFI